MDPVLSRLAGRREDLRGFRSAVAPVRLRARVFECWDASTKTRTDDSPREAPCRGRDVPLRRPGGGRAGPVRHRRGDHPAESLSLRDRPRGVLRHGILCARPHRGRSPALSPAEILAFTVGLTILITSLSALAVSIVGIPITEFAVVIIGLPIGVVAFLMRRPATGPVEALVAFGGRLLDFTDYSAGGRAVAIALFLAVLGGLWGFIDRKSTRLNSS